MGMVIIGGFIVALAIACAVGSAAVLILVFAIRKGYGSWKHFLLMGGGVTVVVGVTALMWMFGGPDSSGAPSGDDYNRFILGAALLGSSPGLGALAGLLTLFKRNAQGPLGPTGGRA
ncbi:MULTISPECIES: hypothetical protein [Myxococcus]|uniref:hypothetical protein n=1 Tax=Myxococcus TaxID=32 RepID=UPI001127CC44|nr:MULTISPECIES: hypothetical protein [Myxococcus]QDE98110.1 hypothetical protein BHS05_20970 [Myxococcus xanthus]QDF05820.1 hypothetical protein BHS04_21810 [Myxococcus xanthus]WAM23286.1 hypothetical protein OZ403_22230 [Myxococcus sp. NMCA1]